MKKRTSELKISNEEHTTTLEIVSQQKEEIEAQANELISTNDRLIQLDKFKEGVTQMIIHDLKNPLSVIIARSEHDEIIKSSSQNMLNLVLNILDVQKSESTKLKLRKKAISLSDIFETAIEQVNFWVKEKNIQLEVRSTPQVFVNVDAELIVRVIVNI